jgi:D-alanyl-D-alanine carboxypeptidase
MQSQLCTLRLSNSTDETGLKAWMNCISALHLDPKLQELNDAGDSVGFIGRYTEFASQPGLLKFGQVSIVNSEPKNVELGFVTKQEIDPDFLKDQTYVTIAGQNGRENFRQTVLKVNDKVTSPLELMRQTETAVINATKFIGQREQSDVVAELKDNFAALIKAVTDNDVVRFGELMLGGNADSLAQIRSIANYNYKLTNASLGNFTLSVTDTPGERYVHIGQFAVSQKSCQSTITAAYDTQEHNYVFENLANTLGNLCNPPSVTKTTSGEILLNCKDCSLAAVDKVYKLPSTYAPAVVNLSLTGGGQLTQTAANAMTSLFQDASSKGLSLRIASSYRSYQTQVSTFEGWVQSEMAKGYSRAEAEARANTYSAKPGHSEHQLGTTADISCVGCTSFDFGPGNSAVYFYLEQNAHKFGFVISYPKNMQLLTGYTYEPWHIRYIGVSLATELFNTGYTAGNGNYLAKFLRDKGLSSV